jgi:hypothetical protein
MASNIIKFKEVMKELWDIVHDPSRLTDDYVAENYITWDKFEQMEQRAKHFSDRFSQQKIGYDELEAKTDLELSGAQALLKGYQNQLKKAITNPSDQQHQTEDSRESEGGEEDPEQPQRTVHVIIRDEADDMYKRIVAQSITISQLKGQDNWANGMSQSELCFGVRCLSLLSKSQSCTRGIRMQYILAGVWKHRWCYSSRKLSREQSGPTSPLAHSTGTARWVVWEHYGGRKPIRVERRTMMMAWDLPSWTGTTIGLWKNSNRRWWRYGSEYNTIDCQLQHGLSTSNFSPQWTKKTATGQWCTGKTWEVKCFRLLSRMM